MIDRLRKQIHELLEQLLEETEKLRKGLTALDPRRSTVTSDTEAPGALARCDPVAFQVCGQNKRPHATHEATRTRVLASLTDGEAMTGGEGAPRPGSRAGRSQPG